MSGLIRLIVGRPKSTQIAGFQVQTSVYSRPIPIVYGRTRIAGNLVHMPATPVIIGKAQAGKVARSKGATGGDTYGAPMVIALCEGPIAGIGNVWRDKDTPVPYVGNYDVAGWTLKLGTISQAAWSYLTSKFPAQAVPYQFTAYVANPLTPLPSDSMPQWSWEIQGFLPFQGFGVGQIADASPADIISDLATNANYGIGLASAQLASMTTMQDYCAAAGLFCSPAIDESKPAADWFNELCEVGNTALVWSDGKLKCIPYGDVALTGNGHTYTPNTTPLYDLTDADILPPGGDKDPIQMNRKDPALAVNQVTVEYLDATHDYNVVTYTAKAQESINRYGTTALTVALHSITSAAVAQLVAQTRLQREQNVLNTYAFRLGWRHSLLEPMDLVTLTDVGLGLSKTPVRLTSIIEGTDEAGSDVIAEDWPFGTASATAYTTPNPLGTATDANVSPGNTATPIITEAPGALKTSPLDLLIAASGGVNWGGCDVYISTDNVAFSKVGRIVGAAAMGGSTNTFNSPGVGPWPALDLTNSLAVDISASLRTLSSYSATDFANLIPTCYIDGEWIAFETATLTGTGRYTLTTLYRGLYNSAFGVHAPSSKFFLLDDSIARIPWLQGKAGQTVYFKLPAFNIYGAALQDVATVSSVAYTIGADPTSFNNANPQGTISVTSNGACSATSDGPSNAASYRYAFSTSSYPADATVAASGTVVNGRSFSLTNFVTLTFGQEVFLTIVPFSAAGGNGLQLPSIHIRGAFQTFSAVRSVTFSGVDWVGSGTKTSLDIANPAVPAHGTAIATKMMGGIPQNAPIQSVSCYVTWNAATNPLTSVQLQVTYLPRSGFTSIALGNATYAGGAQVVSASFGGGISLVSGDLLQAVATWDNSASAVGADVGQSKFADVTVTYLIPDPSKGI